MVWALLTTPATTLPLLYWAESNQTLKRFAESLHPAGAAALIGLILIGLPVTAILIASASVSRINSSWSPVGGGSLARYALGIGILSALAAVVIFVVDLL
ncbi:MAG: hypothetical protein JWL59_2783 [Chthoniobacteraceae bacterium]|nr:hypothetical protein [Chthoniobacteraceae bacterium]